MATPAGGDPSLAVYERHAADYAEQFPPLHRRRAAALAAACEPGPVLDLGCGPGPYFPDLGPRPVGLDAAAAMVELARAQHPEVPVVRAELAALPLRRGSGGAAWARHSYLHLPHDALPMALWDLHRALRPGAPLVLSVERGEGEVDVGEGSPLPGRRIHRWGAARLLDVLVGAGFERVAVDEVGDSLFASARAGRTLADTVGPAMRLLVVGLNPSLAAADAGVAFVGATNRFWPAAVDAGLVTAPRDPVAALRRHGVGLTDLVKRATPRADALSPAEYREGAGRVERLVRWLRPGAVAFVGLAGYRAAVDRTAVAGLQPGRFGGRPAYVLPSTSGANARTGRSELARHLGQALSSGRRTP